MNKEKFEMQQTWHKAKAIASKPPKSKKVIAYFFCALAKKTFSFFYTALIFWLLFDQANALACSALRSHEHQLKK